MKSSVARIIKEELKKSRGSLPKCFTLDYIQSVYNIHESGAGNYDTKSVQYVKYGCEYCTMLELISANSQAVQS